MIQSHIILTETSLDLDSVSSALAFNLFQKINSKDFVDQKFNKVIKCFCEQTTIFTTQQDLDRNWKHYFSTNQILIANFKDKEDFTDSILEYYKNYTDPTFLFLGDLNSYSTLLQEGMLRLLEEPPKNLNIILFATNKTQILPTIQSRAQTYRLSKSLVLSNLNQTLLEKVKKKLPQVSDFTKDFIQNKELVFPDLKTVERDEIDFWLWQVLCYLEEYYKHKPSAVFASKIENLLTALKLNSQNLQKKFVLGWLKTNQI